MNEPQNRTKDPQQAGCLPRLCSPVGRLAPCPFCGSDGAKCDYTILDKASAACTDRIWFIHCDKCGADGPVDNYQRGASDKWNRRANDKAEQPPDSGTTKHTP